MALSALAAAVLAAGLLVAYACTQTEPTADYALKQEAARRMEVCLEAVRRYKAERGIPLSTEDIHGSGLIGASWTGLTTTLGAPEAKRTAANPDMAALMVELFTGAGLTAGDRVAAGFSGSFPGLNLAVLCAGEAMGLEVVYISSVGASTFGANQPELTFPDMAFLLAQEGLISSPGAANTLGGAGDCGLDMDQDALAPIRQRLEGYPVPLLVEEDYEENLRRRMEFYESEAPVDCFVGVGGNITTAGLGEAQFPWGLTPAGTVLRPDNAHSGLLARYNARGLPVIHLLNLRQLVADYGLPYDPEHLAPAGESAIYWRRNTPALPAALGISAALLVLLYGRITRRKGAEPWQEDA